MGLHVKCGILFLFLFNSSDERKQFIGFHILTRKVDRRIGVMWPWRRSCQGHTAPSVYGRCAQRLGE